MEGVLQHTNEPFNQFCPCGIVGEMESPISVHLAQPLLDLVAYEMGSLVTFNDFRGAISCAQLSKASNGSPLSGTPAWVSLKKVSCGGHTGQSKLGPLRAG